MKDSPGYCGHSFELVGAGVNALSWTNSYDFDFGPGHSNIFCGFLEFAF